MSVDGAYIIEFGQWLSTPMGQVLLGWEQAQLDECVADAFGYHALQVGIVEIDGLRANRMPHRWVATRPEDEADCPIAMPPPEDDRTTIMPLASPVALYCSPEALPFADQSLDLLLLPHTLEWTDDPHLALAEVARVLRPEGKVIITAFNAWSLWRLRQLAGHLMQRIGIRSVPLFLPRSGEYIPLKRAKDWMRLLDIDIEAERIGVFRSPWRGGRALARAGWMEGTLSKLWPKFGAAYVLVGVKRVRGMRLVGLAKQRAQKRAGLVRA